MTEGTGSGPAGEDSANETVLGEIAVELNLITIERLERALQTQSDARAEGRTLPLSQILVDEGAITLDNLHRLFREQGRRSESFPEIPRYRILDRIGEGASAIVYRGQDRDLNRPVAVKVLRDTMGLSEVARARFRREAQVAASLAHPNLITIHDAGEVKGFLYLVMELIDGKPLGDLLRSGPDERTLLGLLERAARGVAVGHAKGIVHRDLKPANILVTSAGEPKVGDFGLAHLVDSSTPLTRTGTTLGTPLYMAPEQVDGKSKEITPRTDVYALGAILYEALVGAPPHPGETLPEIYAHITEEEPLPPRQVKPGIARELEAIVLKALERNPGRRYGDALELAQDLRRYLDGEPLSARPVSPVARLWRKAVKYRAVVIPAATLCVGAGVLLAVTSWLSTGREREFAAKARGLEESLHRLKAGPSVPDSSGLRAVLEHCRGEVLVLRRDQRLAGKDGMTLTSEDTLVAGSDGSVVLKYPDQSAVTVKAGAVLRHADRRPLPGRIETGKLMFVDRGYVRADITPQPVDQPMYFVTPHAGLEVASGKCAVTAGPFWTRAEMYVQVGLLVNRMDGTSARVPASNAATVKRHMPIEVKPIHALASVPQENLRLWLRQDGKDLHDGPIAQWSDESASGAFAWQDTVSNRPIRVDQAVRFDGTDNFLRLEQDFGSIARGVSVFAVVRPAPGSAPGPVLELTLGKDRPVLTVEAGAHAAIASTTVADGPTLKSRRGLATDRFQTLAFVLHPAGPGMLYLDGQPAASGPMTMPPAGSPGSGTLGRRAGSPSFFQGDLAELLVYNAPLIESDRSAVEGYLRRKYGTPGARLDRGLKAEYFASSDLSGTPLTRLDEALWFDWGPDVAPDPSLPAESFSARWTGRIEAPSTLTYTFGVQVEGGGVRLWIDGRLVIDQWPATTSRELTASVPLRAGQLHDLKMEYTRKRGAAVSKLYWSSPSVGSTMVPQEYLHPPK